MSRESERTVVVGDRIRILRPATLEGKLAEVIAVIDGFEDGGALIDVRLDDGQHDVLVVPIDTFEFVDKEGDRT